MGRAEEGEALLRVRQSGTRMGGNSSKLTKQEVDTYKQLTYLTEKDIMACYKRFSRLMDEETMSAVSSINDPRCWAEAAQVVERTSELKVNPFASRLCEVFAARPGRVTFEEFLDLMSVLSEAAPPAVKAEWAFKMFDMDGDGLLGRADIGETVRLLTGPDSALSPTELDSVVENVLEETDLNRTGFISLVEFSQIVTK